MIAAPAPPRRLRSALPTVVAFSMAVATVVLLIVALGLTAFVHWPPSDFSPALWFASVFSAIGLSFTIVGTLVAVRVPRNLLGWLMAVIGLAAGVTIAGSTIGLFDRDIAHGTVPSATFLTWLAQWLFEPAVLSAVVFIPLLFPAGRLASPRWRAFVAVAILAITAQTLQTALLPWAPGQFPGIANPYAVEGPVVGLINAAATVSGITGGPALLLVLGSLVLRFRRSKGVEREQFKWFVSAGAVALLAQVASNLTSGPVSDALFMGGLATLGLLPVAIGIAILRYRLYDIDVVINRTLVYGSLTVVLAAVYAASVLALETVLAPLTRASSLSVAGSTLLVAALFAPARRRVQSIVDRHFYRRRYDAAREIAGFGVRLRDEVEPQRLASAIASTLDRTVEPSFASIWLREAGER